MSDWRNWPERRKLSELQDKLDIHGKVALSESGVLNEYLDMTSERRAHQAPDRVLLIATAATIAVQVYNHHAKEDPDPEDPDPWESFIAQVADESVDLAAAIIAEVDKRAVPK